MEVPDDVSNIGSRRTLKSPQRIKIPFWELCFKVELYATKMNLLHLQVMQRLHPWLSAEVIPHMLTGVSHFETVIVCWECSLSCACAA